MNENKESVNDSLDISNDFCRDEIAPMLSMFISKIDRNQITKREREVLFDLYLSHSLSIGGETYENFMRYWTMGYYVYSNLERGEEENGEEKDE